MRTICVEITSKVVCEVSSLLNFDENYTEIRKEYIFSVESILSTDSLYFLSYSASCYLFTSHFWKCWKFVPRTHGNVD